MGAAAARLSGGDRVDGGRRAAAIGPLAGSTATAVVLVVASFSLPMTSPTALGSLVVLVGGLGLVGALLGWQIRTILVTPFPAARAVAPSSSRCGCSSPCSRQRR